MSVKREFNMLQNASKYVIRAIDVVININIIMGVTTILKPTNITGLFGIIAVQGG